MTRPRRFPALPVEERVGDDLALGDRTTWSGHRLTVRILPEGQAARRARTVLCEVLRDVDMSESDVTDAELAVGELAANAEEHARGPYELRIVFAGGLPVWCEVIDSAPDLAGIPEAFAKLHQDAVPDDPIRPEEPPSAHGHGLAIVHHLSGGRCQAFPTVAFATGLPGKAVAFALPGGGRPP